jgi:hypothetical protein
MRFVDEAADGEQVEADLDHGLAVAPMLSAAAARPDCRCRPTIRSC